MLLPQIIDSVVSIGVGMPGMVESLTKWIGTVLSNNPELQQVAELANSEEENDVVISQTTYGYSNDHMLPISETYQRGGGVTYEVTYAYDSRGNLQSIRQNNYNTTTYTYDALNRLTEETINGTVKSYTYNDEDKGRMSSFNDTAMDYDDRGRLETFGDFKFEYDNYGNRTKKKNEITNEILSSSLYV